MQYAFHRVCNGDPFTDQRIALRFQRLYIAGHLRRFTKQDVQRQIDRLIIKMTIVQRKMQFFGRFTNHRVGRAFTLTQFVKQR